MLTPGQRDELWSRHYHIVEDLTKRAVRALRRKHSEVCVTRQDLLCWGEGGLEEVIDACAGRDDFAVIAKVRAYRAINTELYARHFSRLTRAERNRRAGVRLCPVCGGSGVIVLLVSTRRCRDCRATGRADLSESIRLW